MTSKNVNVKTERNSQSREPDKRMQPFVSVLLVALLVIPAFCIVLRLFIAYNPAIQWLIVWLDLFLFGVVAFVAALAYGFRVAKREPLVTWQVAVTIESFAVATSLLMLPGWSRPYEGNWFERQWLRIVDAATVPGWAAVLYLFGALCVTLVWWLPRLDAFRSSTAAEGEDNGTGKLKDLLRGAKLRINEAKVDEYAVEIPVDHEGVPVAQIRQALPALDETPGVIRGRSSVSGSEIGGRSTLRFVHTDPHNEWKKWPGLSHPGGTYTDPIRTSYYSTGEVQWYSFVKTPEGYQSKVAPGFKNTNDTFKGGQGATGSGKSGGSALETGEVLSRRDVAVVYVDTAKLMQNAGWCLEFCSLAAGSKPASRSLFNALRKLGEHRARKLGEAGVRNFTSEAALRLGRPWVHIYADEFDVAAQSADLEWLATKGRSLGFRISYTLPRAVGDKLSTDVRAATGMWEQYGITQDYDKGFVLSAETMEAGANPEAFGVSRPGVHYLDRCSAIKPAMWAVDCRTYMTDEDYGDLRAAVIAARKTFTPMDFPPDELEVLGDVARYCRPEVVRTGHMGVDEEAPVDVVAAVHEAGDLLERAKAAEAAQTSDADPGARFRLSGDEMQDTDLLDGFEPPSLDTSEIEAEYGPIDPREPIPRPEPDGITLPTEKPRAANWQQANAELDAALIRMDARGVREFRSKDVAAEMAVDFHASWMSDRMTELSRNATLTPPGLKLEKLGRGQWLLVRIADHGRQR